MKKVSSYIRCLFLCLSILFLGGRLLAETCQCVGGEGHYDTWEREFKLNKLDIPFPAGADPCERITGGSVLTTSKSVILAFWSLGSDPRDVLGDHYSVWCYGKRNKIWETAKIMEGDSPVGGSIVGLQELQHGYLIEFNGHMIGTYQVLDSEFKPVMNFEGIDVFELPDGSLFSAAWGGYGEPCVVSLHHLSPRVDTCVFDWNDPRFASYEPLIVNGVVYNPALGVFGAEINVCEPTHDMYGPDEDTPAKEKVLGLALDCGGPICHHYYLDFKSSLEKVGARSLTEFMTSKCLVKFFSENIKEEKLKNVGGPTEPEVLLSQ